MAFVLPVLIIAAVLLAAPQAVIGVAIVGIAAGLSAVVGRLVFGLGRSAR
jgi:ABC-type uncharacterized transport system permease subunit